MPKVSLDADVLADAVSDRLSEREKAVIDSSEIVVSPLAIRKLASLIRRGRVRDLDIDDPRLDALVDGADLVQITPDMAERAVQLGLRSGPADEIIAATSILLEAPLLTRDQHLTAVDDVPTPDGGQT